MDSTAELKLLVGLGNPGVRYALTRHNAGWQVTDLVATTSQPEAVKTLWQPGNGELQWLTLQGKSLLFLKPLTYMNLSGEAVANTLQHFHITPKEMLVVSDDLDLPVGNLRLRAKGSSGGHRGLSSIIQCLQTEDFPRLRVGIGRPQPGSGTPIIDWVLAPWVSAEENPASQTLRKAAEVVLLAISGSFNRAVQAAVQV
ncbi:MAG: aminoacyl-tRNA hydrolase [Victivallales bacterium]|nr:aminoacyl-tRNA hydrolase [Victivallales bacterium]